MWFLAPGTFREGSSPKGDVLATSKQTGNSYKEHPMKYFVLSLSLLFSATTEAATITNAFVQDEAIVLDIAYSGGCEEHRFELRLGDSCAESFPVQCWAELVDSGSRDACEMWIEERVSFSLESLGLMDPYFNGAHLTIVSEDSRVKLQLPWQER